MTTGDWFAAAGIVLPLVSKVALDFAAYLESRKRFALAAIVGMSARQAATTARALSNIPPGADAASYERALITSATDTIMTEMDKKAARISADAPQVQTIVQGELDKLIVAPVAIVPPAGVTSTI